MNQKFECNHEALQHCKSWSCWQDHCCGGQGAGQRRGAAAARAGSAQALAKLSSVLIQG